MLRVVANVTELIGQTPLFAPQRLFDHEKQAQVLLKLERFNPGGSVKDRPAYNMMQEAILRGALRKGMTIIEPTSGNTGIGIAMVCAALGYPAILVMPDSMTKERIDILKAYGAQVVLTPGQLRMTGAVQKANELLATMGDQAMILGQFDNPDNPGAHRKSTALEILTQTDGNLDAFVCTAGTGGTVTGVGETLKSHLSSLTITVVEPAGSPVLSGGQPGPHKIVGTSPGFIPSILNTSIYDQIVQVTDENAIQWMRRAAREEGLLVGVSCGAVMYAADQVAKQLGPGKRIVALCPDTGERYLSMGLF